MILLCWAMINAFRHDSQRLVSTRLEGGLPENLVWIDLLNPTREEEEHVEKLLAIDIPTRDEIREIEISNTLYEEDGAVYTTATLVTQSDTPEPELHPVSFILIRNILVTLRYAEPKAFNIFLSKLPHFPSSFPDGHAVLIGLLDVIVGRAADSLEKASRLIEDNTKIIFRPIARKYASSPRISFEEILVQIGGIGNLVSKVNEGVVSVLRLAGYVGRTHHFHGKAEELQRLEIIIRDAVALRDYAASLAVKVGFLLDATLGMINIEQNATIKIFSVAAVIFLPPTLIASIYGMNFHHMPELDWRLGYPMGLLLMVLSAWLPYRFFKKKGWL